MGQVSHGHFGVLNGDEFVGLKYLGLPNDLRHQYVCAHGLVFVFQPKGVLPVSEVYRLSVVCLNGPPKKLPILIPFPILIPIPLKETMIFSRHSLPIAPAIS